MFVPFEISISPNQFGFDLSTAFFVALVVGGLGSAWGPVLGVALYYLAPDHVLPKSLIGLKEQPDLRHPHHRRRRAPALTACPAVDRLSSGHGAWCGGRSRAPAAPAGGRAGRAVLGEPDLRSETAPVVATAASDGRSVPARSDIAARTAAELPELLQRAANQDRSVPALVARGVEVRFSGVVALDGGHARFPAPGRSPP